MIEDLLHELADIGWTVSWAFQFEPNHWRVSIMKRIDDRVYMSHCADAPTFPEALEDAMSRISEAEVELTIPITHSFEPKAAPLNLMLALGLAKPATLVRRI